MADPAVKGGPRAYTAGRYLTAGGGAAVLALVLAGAFALQWIAGGARSTFGGASDEAAHYVTSLLVHDYLRQGMPTPPLQYAEQYYLHYPQVAMGHWPPLYYVLAGVWMFVAGDSREALLILAALINAAFAAVVFVWGRREMGVFWASAASFTALLLPFVQQQAAVLMLDMPAALLAAVSLVCLTKAIEADSRGWFLAWGFSLAAALLTKYNPVWLCAVGPLSLLARRQWKWLLSWRLALPAAVVAVLCLPFYLWAREVMTIALAVATSSGRPGVLSHFQDLERSWLALAGWIFFPLAGAGWISRFWRPLFQGTLSPAPAVAGSALAACIAFHWIIPTFIEPRQYLVALAPALLFAWSAVRDVAGVVRRLLRAGRPADWAAAAVVLAAFFMVDFTIPRPAQDSSAAAARMVVASSRKGDSILVASGDYREAVFVAHVAEIDHRPNIKVLRAGKLVALSPWTRHAGQPPSPLLFNRPAELEEAMRDLRIRWVVLLKPAAAVVDPYLDFVRRAIGLNPAAWRRRDDLVPGNGGDVAWERRDESPPSPVRLELRFRKGVGMTLEIAR